MHSTSQSISNTTLRTRVSRLRMLLVVVYCLALLCGNSVAVARTLAAPKLTLYHLETRQVPGADAVIRYVQHDVSVQLLADSDASQAASQAESQGGSQTASNPAPAAASSSASKVSSAAPAGPAASSSSNVHSGEASRASSIAAAASSADHLSSVASSAETTAKPTSSADVSSSSSAESAEAAHTANTSNSSSNSLLESDSYSSGSSFSSGSGSGSGSGSSFGSSFSFSSGSGSGSSFGSGPDSSSSSFASTPVTTSPPLSSSDRASSESSVGVPGEDFASASSAKMASRDSSSGMEATPSASSESTIILTTIVTRELTVVYSVAELTAKQIIQAYCTQRGASVTVLQVARDMQVENSRGYWQRVKADNNPSTSGSFYRSFLSVRTDNAVLDAFVAAANSGGVSGVVLVDDWASKNTKAGKAWIAGLVIGVVASVVAEVLVVLQIVFKQHSRHRGSVYSNDGLYADLEMSQRHIDATAPTPPLPMRERHTR